MENKITLNPKAYLFLTSSPFIFSYENGIFINGGLNKANKLEENLKKYWKNNSKILYITSDPSDREMNESIIESTKTELSKTSLTFQSIELCDGTNQNQNLKDYEVIILGGGHVPTQNKFFESINLREKIKDFEGIIIGISAGSMNSADIVYAQPELKGEAIDPNYNRFLKGLNLTKIQVLPHYYSIKDEKLDGKRIIEDITYDDSVNNCFYILPDGSYIIQSIKDIYLFGEGFVIKDRIMEKICNNEESKKLN